VVQDAQLGMGHAVHLCEQHVKGEPFMLVLGDHLYATTDSAKGGCMQQLIDYYGHNQRPCVAVQDTAEEQVHLYGCVTGVWDEPKMDMKDLVESDAISASNHEVLAKARELIAAVGGLDGAPDYMLLAAQQAETMIQSELKSKQPRSLTVTALKEKPSIEFARAQLQVPGVAGYLTFFGLYILEAPIFNLLGEQAELNARDEKGAFGLTPALEKMRSDSSMMALLVDGNRFDLGTPSQLVNSLTGYNSLHNENNPKESLQADLGTL